MTSTQLASIAGVLLSLAMGYIPGVATWYSALSSQLKVTVMGVLLVLASVGIFALTCAGWMLSSGISLTCDKLGAQTLIAALIAALIANQATFTAFVKPFRK